MTCHRFKSTPENWRKERSGVKPNTVRCIEEDDPRFLIKEGDAIAIENTLTQETFMRVVADVTLWDDLHIISWRHEERAT